VQKVDAMDMDAVVHSPLHPPIRPAKRSRSGECRWRLVARKRMEEMDDAFWDQVMT